MSSVEKLPLYEITPMEADKLKKECKVVSLCFDEATRTIFVQDNWGRLPSYTTIKTIMKGLSNFLETYDDNYINEYNQAVDRELQEEYETMRNFVPIKPPKAGFVFLYQELATGLYRFGETTNMKKRLKGIVNSLQVDIDVLYEIECKDTNTVKEFLCNKFSSKLNEKNWYTLSLDDLEEIKKKDYPPKISELIISEKRIVTSHRI